VPTQGNNMPHIFYLILLTCFFTSATAHGAVSENFLIDKQKLVCMYKQIDDLLDEPNDSLVMVILTNQCARSGGINNNGMITRSLPRLTMNTDNSPSNSSETLGPNDILMLTHTQLECFKENYKNLLIDERNPLPVEFSDSCK